eukprot:864291_1
MSYTTTKTILICFLCTITFTQHHNNNKHDLIILSILKSNESFTYLFHISYQSISNATNSTDQSNSSQCNVFNPRFVASLSALFNKITRNIGNKSFTK